MLIGVSWLLHGLYGLLNIWKLDEIFRLEANEIVQGWFHQWKRLIELVINQISDFVGNLLLSRWSEVKSKD